MSKLIFERGDEDRYELIDDEPQKITFDIPEGSTISEFKLACKRLAAAIGYQREAIENAFGSETNTPEEMAAQAHIREILNQKAVDKFFDIPPTGSKD